MLRAAAVTGVVMVLFSVGTCERGIKDAKEAATRLPYYEYRDMRRSVVPWPNHVVTRGPADESVPLTGKELTYGLEGIDLATRMGNQLKSPLAAVDDSTIERGHRKFLKTCIPCHGTSMAGNGPVAALFMPPPDLLAEATRNRADGYIYSYIRHGGVVMPSYGAQVTSQEAWELIAYIRHMQQTSPR